MTADEFLFYFLVNGYALTSENEDCYFLNKIESEEFDIHIDIFKKTNQCIRYNGNQKINLRTPTTECKKCQKLT